MSRSPTRARNYAAGKHHLKLFGFVSPFLYSVPFIKAVRNKHMQGFTEEHLSNPQFGRNKAGDEKPGPRPMG